MAVNDYDPIIQEAAHEWNVDPLLIKAVMQQESGGNRLKSGKPITSSAGAAGLMQIMPGTAEGLGVADSHDPAQAIFGAAKLLSENLDKYGNPALAVAAYNANPKTIDAWIAGKGQLPDETKKYIPAVAAYYSAFQKAVGSSSGSFGPLTPVAGAPTVQSSSQNLSDDDFLKSVNSRSTVTPNAAPNAATMSDDDFLRIVNGEPVPTGAAQKPNAASDSAASAPDNLGDTAMTTAQMAESRARMAAGPYASLEPKEPGLAHLAWTVGSFPGRIIDVLTGHSPIPQGKQVAGLEMAAPLAAGDVRFSNPLASRAVAPSAPTGEMTTPTPPQANPLIAQAPPQTIIPAPSFVPPGSQVPVLPRATALLAEDARIAANRPAEIPPTAVTDPLTGQTVPVVQPANPLSAGPATVPYANPLSATAVVPTAAPAAPALPAAQVAATVAPRTAGAAKKIASAYYQKADQVGGTLAPDFTNRFLDRVQSVAPQTEEGRVVAGENPVTQLVDRIQSLRDQPISLAGAQEIDEGLGNLIDKEFGPKGLSKDGKSLLDLQTTFRDMIQNAGPQDTSGGTQGFDALNAGRKAWAQAMKMSDLERIQARAEMTDNPATGVKSGIRVLLSNPTRARGYSAEEIAALKQASERGILGGALHVFGSRLVPLAAGGATFGAGGFIPALAAAGVTHVGSSLMRRGATNLQTRRLNNALSVLGSSVPPPP